MTMGADPFAWPYHRRDPDGQFARGEAVLWAPRRASTLVGDATLGDGLIKR